MRNMSFMLTTPQVRARTKDVTRRLGWAFVKPGDQIRAIVKGQGLKKGETVEPLAVLAVVSVRREPLWHISADDVTREGFTCSAQDFIAMFCATHKGCTPKTLVTRIEFTYLPDPGRETPDQREP